MKKLLFLLSMLTMISCSKKEAFINNNGCLVCDGYKTGEYFVYDGLNYVVADKGMLENAIIDGDDLTRYCTSSIKDMSALFMNAADFNQNISNWDVHNVTNMTEMFSGAAAFNQDIGNWDVSNVTDMDEMFFDATDFNQNLTQWCVPYFFSVPSDFSTNSALTASNHPVWGTCP